MLLEIEKYHQCIAQAHHLQERDVGAAKVLVHQDGGQLPGLHVLSAVLLPELGLLAVYKIILEELRRYVMSNIFQSLCCNLIALSYK